VGLELRTLDSVVLSLRGVVVFCGGDGGGGKVTSAFSKSQPVSPSASVRRLQLLEELDRSSCGNVLFTGYLPPPGGNY